MDPYGNFRSSLVPAPDETHYCGVAGVWLGNCDGASLFKVFWVHQWFI